MDFTEKKKTDGVQDRKREHSTGFVGTDITRKQKTRCKYSKQLAEMSVRSKFYRPVFRIPRPKR